MTEIEKLKQQLQEQERLASLGMLSAGIAHELQNPLNFVINFSRLSAQLVDDLTDILGRYADRFDEADDADLSETMDNWLLPTLRLHANAHFIGKRYLEPNCYPYLSYYDVFPEASSVLTLDLGANWSWRNLGVNANIHNLLGTRYWQSGMSISYNVPQQGRWFLVELTCKF